MFKVSKVKSESSEFSLLPSVVNTLLLLIVVFVFVHVYECGISSTSATVCTPPQVFMCLTE